MSHTFEGGASIAWRLLATLEGGSLLLVASALLTYTARNRAVRKRRTSTLCSNVAITNSTNELGKEVKRRLEAHGCVVSTVTNETSSRAGSEPYDALVVIGAQPNTDGLNGISDVVMEDVNINIKLLENLSACVNPGGCIVWACAGADKSLGAFDSAANAFDAVLRTSLIHIAKVFHCVPIWVGRCNGAERAAERVVAALVTSDLDYNSTRFSIRNAAHTVGEYLYTRWLKIIT